jgi:ubiquinone/menaquinone biosynthesis C-methylase UbiE
VGQEGNIDRLAGSPWSAPATVAGFAHSQPNPTLLKFAQAELADRRGIWALDIGCGAARNALPLAASGWNVLGVDLSTPMIAAAAHRAPSERGARHLRFAVAPMDEIPAAADSFDLIVAHGIWNLATSTAEFRRAVGEASRVARPGAGLFVFTFSRNTLPLDAQPVPGEAFVYTQFSGQPQCFLTDHQLLAELADAGFVPAGGAPLVEHNRRRPGTFQSSAPVIYEGMFRYDR